MIQQLFKPCNVIVAVNKRWCQSQTSHKLTWRHAKGTEQAINRDVTPVLRGFNTVKLFMTLWFHRCTFLRLSNGRWKRSKSLGCYWLTKQHRSRIHARKRAILVRRRLVVCELARPRSPNLFLIRVECSIICFFQGAPMGLRSMI